MRAIEEDYEFRMKNLEELNENAVEAYKDGDIELARRAWTEALNISLQIDVPLDSVPYYNNLGILYRDESSFEQAELLLMRGLAIVQKELGSQSPAYAKMLNNLACVYLGSHREDLAESLIQTSIEILERESGEGKAHAIALRNLARLFQCRGEITSAKEACWSAVNKGIEAFGVDSEIVSDWLEMLKGLDREQLEHIA